MGTTWCLEIGKSRIGYNLINSSGYASTLPFKNGGSNRFHTRYRVDTSFISFDITGQFTASNILKTSFVFIMKRIGVLKTSRPFVMFIPIFVFNADLVSLHVSDTLPLFHLFMSPSCRPVMFWRGLDAYLKPHPKQHSIDWRLFEPFWALPVLAGLVSGSYLGQFVRHVPWFCLIWPGRAFLDVLAKTPGIFGLSPFCYSSCSDRLYSFPFSFSLHFSWPPILW